MHTLCHMHQLNKESFLSDNWNKYLSCGLRDFVNDEFSRVEITKFDEET